MDKPERFLDNTWVLSRIPLIRENALLYAPPAFRRHGALPDPRDLDRRGGEWFEWVPGNWSPLMTIEHPTPPPPAVRVMRAFVQWWETLGQQAAVKRVAEGHTAGAPGLPAHDEWWRWDADEMAAAVAFLERSSSDSQAPPAGNPPESANRL